VTRPFASHPAPNKRQFTTVAGGNRAPGASQESGGIIGATPLGGSYVITNSQQGRHKQPVGLQVMPHKPFTSNTGNGNQNDEND